MGKVLILLLIVALFFVVRAMVRSRADSADRASAARGEPERMVNCKQCGVYLPESEALEDRGDYYCSAQHRRIASR